MNKNNKKVTSNKDKPTKSRELTKKKSMWTKLLLRTSFILRGLMSGTRAPLLTPCWRTLTTFLGCMLPVVFGVETATPGGLPSLRGLPGPRPYVSSKSEAQRLLIFIRIISEIKQTLLTLLRSFDFPVASGAVPLTRLGDDTEGKFVVREEDGVEE